MATPYEKVYNKFLGLIKDFNLVELDDYTMDQMMLDWLDRATIDMRRCEHDFSKRDNDLQEFEEDLSNFEIELLARGMVNAWLEPYINSSELTTQFIGGKEEKFYSTAQHLSTLLEMRDRNVRRMNSLHNYYTYTNNSYFDN